MQTLKTLDSILIQETWLKSVHSMVYTRNASPKTTLPSCCSLLQSFQLLWYLWQRDNVFFCASLRLQSLTCFSLTSQQSQRQISAPGSSSDHWPSAEHVYLKSLKTLETQSNMMLRLKSETLCVCSHQMSHASPLCISILLRRCLCDPCRHGPPHAYLHIFTFVVVPTPFFMAVGDVSQAFSVRNELGGANRLAKYENWMTINGYVLLSAEDNDCVRARASLSSPLIFSVWIGTCHHILTSLLAFFMSSVHKIVK